MLPNLAIFPLFLVLSIPLALLFKGLGGWTWILRIKDYPSNLLLLLLFPFFSLTSSLEFGLEFMVGAYQRFEGLGFRFCALRTRLPNCVCAHARAHTHTNIYIWLYMSMGLGVYGRWLLWILGFQLKCKLRIVLQGLGSQV